MALKDLMQTVVKPALLASFKVPKETKVEKKLELPKEMEAEEEDDEMEDMEEVAEKPKAMSISITKLASLEKQKDSKKKSKKK